MFIVVLSQASAHLCVYYNLMFLFSLKFLVSIVGCVRIYVNLQ